MSRVLARNMFKKNAPKRSAKGVGITSMLEDDVAGYAEGGEVTDDRTERERLARQLLEQGRDEYAGYQQFSEQERPRMYRPPATSGMVPPQPNPQQMQAMQMQQMAQMGMLPRFQRGGIVSSGIGPIGDNIPTFTPGQDPFAPPTDMQAPTLPLEVPPMLDGREPAGPGQPYSPKTPAMRYLYDLIAPTPKGIAAVERSQESARKAAEVERAKEQNPLPGLFDEVSAEESAAAQQRQKAAVQKVLGVPSQEEISSADRDARELDREYREVQKQTRRLRDQDKKAPSLPPPPSSGAGKETDLSAIKVDREAKAAAARQENIYLALMQAGLAIAGGKSSNALTNIGQGGQAGLASFMALEQQRRRDEDAAMRRDLAEREYGLQVRRQQMQEPYIQAQTEYLRMRPAIAAAQLQARQQGILAKAQMDAVRDIDAIEAKNPLAYSTNGKPDQMKKDIAIQRRTQQIAAQYAAIYGGGGGPMDRLGLGLGGGSADEE